MLKLEKKSFQQIKIYIRNFEKSENTIEAIFFLNEILTMLEKTGDERVNNFLNKIQEELNFELGTNWKKILLSFPELKCCYSVSKYLFLKDDLEKRTIIPHQGTAWDVLQKNIISTFDRYEVMFGQMVPIQIS